MNYNYLIVGSGLYGATIAQQAKKAGKSVLVIDKVLNEMWQFMGIVCLAVALMVSKLALSSFSSLP